MTVLRIKNLPPVTTTTVGDIVLIDGATTRGITVENLFTGRALVATTINGNTFTAGTGALTIAAAKTLTASNSLTLAGTDGTTQTFPTTSGTVVTSASVTGGDLTGTYPSPTLGANIVTNAKAAQMAPNTIKGNNTGSTANAVDLTVSQVSALLGVTSAVFGARLAKTALYTVAIGDDGSTIALGGSAFYALTFPTASTLNATHKNVVVNEDTVRAKSIVITGGTNFFLYPGQTAIVYNDNNVWKVIRNNRWRLPAATTVFFDFVNGNDTNDGLAAGAGNALKLPQTAYDLAANSFDLNGQQITFQGAAGQTYTNGGISTSRGMVGSAGPQFVILDYGGSSVVMGNGTGVLEIGSGVGTSGTAFMIQNAVMSSSVSIIDNFGGVILCGPGLTFGVANGGSHIKAAHPGAQVFMLNNYTVSGNAGAFHYDAETGGMIVTHGLTATAAGVTAFGSGFASAFGAALLYAGGMTFTGFGSVTGQRRAMWDFR